MSWSSCETSRNARFGSRSGFLRESSDLHTSVSVDVLESWSVEFWYYKEEPGPCTLLRSEEPTLHIMLNRRGRYILRLSGQHGEGKPCEVSRVSLYTTLENAWNHICIQYDRKDQVYTLYSNGTGIIVQKCGNMSTRVFNRLHLGSPGFIGNMDSVRISSCLRYKGMYYKIPETSPVPDACTLTLNDFEEPIFAVDSGVIQTENNWYNTSLNKTEKEFMTGTRSLFVGEDTQFLPGLRTPGVDMNSVNWTVEFFFKPLREFDDTRVIMERGGMSIVLSSGSLRVLSDKRILRIVKKSIVFGEWNHLCLCHDVESKSISIGSNGSLKRCKGHPKIEKCVDITIGSIGTIPIFYDSFRLSSSIFYGKEYYVPHPEEDRWSCLDTNTLLYTGFENPEFVASNITSFSVLLSWQEPLTYGKRGIFTIYINGKRSRYSTRDTELNIYGLEEGKEYEFSVHCDGKKIYKSISAKTIAVSKDNSFNVLSSISTRGKYDFSKLPTKVVRTMDMGSIFDNKDRIIVPSTKSRILDTRVVARFTSVSSVVDASTSRALLVPFQNKGQSIGIKGDDGSTTNVSFIDGGVEVDGSTLKPGGYVVVGGRKMRVMNV